jgi:hypothetical protein
VLARTASHGSIKEWFKDVRRIEITSFETALAARNAEHQAIELEDPTYNVMHRSSGQNPPESRAVSVVALENVDTRGMTLGEISRAMGVSIPLLSRSLNGKRKVDEHFRDRFVRGIELAGLIKIRKILNVCKLEEQIPP